MLFATSPDWLQAVRLLVTFVLTACLGAHAFYRFRALSGSGSPKLWAFLMYSLAFVFSSALHFVSLLITVATRAYGPIPQISLGPFTIALLITYAAFSITVRPSSSLQRGP